MTHTETYYNHVIDLLLETYKSEFLYAKAGHCIKISGFPQSHLTDLLHSLQAQYPHIRSYILSDRTFSKEYITPTKLIEFRNQEIFPLAVLVPVNIRTAAEDSFGNATFKHINLSGIDEQLYQRLRKRIPSEVAPIFSETVQFLDSVSTANLVNLLITWENDQYRKDALGKHIHLIGLIPDNALTADQRKIRATLNFNQTSTKLISDFNLSIYDRVRRLPLDKDTIQRKLVNFLKENDECRTQVDLLEKIVLRSDLDFAN